MRGTFISEKIKPLDGSFDTDRMAIGEPGLPLRFRWRKQDWEIAAVLESGRDHGDCSHGSGERYVRRHVYRVIATDGTIFRLYFQRSFGRGRPAAASSRWWIYEVEPGQGMSLAVAKEA